MSDNISTALIQTILASWTNCQGSLACQSTIVWWVSSGEVLTWIIWKKFAISRTPRITALIAIISAKDFTIFIVFCFNCLTSFYVLYINIFIKKSRYLIKIYRKFLSRKKSMRTNKPTYNTNHENFLFLIYTSFSSFFFRFIFFL